MIKVYVAGAYSDDNVLGVLKNIGRGEYYASLLFQKGYAPFTPWHDKNYAINNWSEDLTVKMFLEYSLEWLRVSDCMLVVPNHSGLKRWGDSKGVEDEILEADKSGIPIFYELEDLDKFYDK